MDPLCSKRYAPSSVLTDYKLQMKVGSLKGETKVSAVDSVIQIMDKPVNEEELRARVKDINTLIEKQLELKYEKENHSFFVHLTDKKTHEVVKEISLSKLMNEPLGNEELIGVLLDELI